MKKPIVLLALGALVFAARPAREQVGARMEPILARASMVPVHGAEATLNHLFAWQAREELVMIRQYLEAHVREGKRVPREPREFRRLLRQGRIAGGGADPWGSPYEIRRSADQMAVVSAGADRQLGTADDLQERFILGR